MGLERDVNMASGVLSPGPGCRREDLLRPGARFSVAKAHGPSDVCSPLSHFIWAWCALEAFPGVPCRAVVVRHSKT